MQVVFDNYEDNTIHFIYQDRISYYNLLTNSQITFQIDRDFPKYINLSVKVKDNKKLIIIGEKKASEFYLAAYSLYDKAAMKEGRR